MKRKNLAIAFAMVAAAFAGGVQAQNEQFIPANGYWVGPYAPGGSGYFGGMLDYFSLLNERDGGIGGVKIVWEKCETEYNNARAVECYERSKGKGPTGAVLLHPFSTGATYSLFERTQKDKISIIAPGHGRTDSADGRVFPYAYPIITTEWSGAYATIAFIGKREGGMDKLKGKKIVNLFHDSAYGKETHVVVDSMAKTYGFEVIHIAVPHPGVEQQAQWLQIRQSKADWVILRGWGVMNPTAIKNAAKIGFRRDHMIGVWWSGAEEDVIPAGDVAKGFIAYLFNLPGANYPVMKEIQKYVYAKGKGELQDQPKWRFGSVYHTMGVVAGIFSAEAIRVAQEKYGKKPLTGEQANWGMEHLNIDEKRLKELGATGMMQPLKVTCMDHEGGGGVKFVQWDGKTWKGISEWVYADQSILRPMIENSAAAYAKEKGITPRDCSKEQ
jgi:branched-chain amino acid transport system substrate-binding protein